MKSSACTADAVKPYLPIKFSPWLIFAAWGKAAFR
jgi:hypothetical protein